MSAQSKPVSDDSVELGESVSKHRTSNGLSQADIHNWGTDRKQKLYGSQLAYFERGTLMPKHQFFVALGKLNDDLANEGANGFKFIQKETTRERLQKATPFLTHDGRVATATDYFSMFIGQQPINRIYSKADELTPEFIRKYFEASAKAFEQVRRENVWSRKDAWIALCDTKAMKQVTEQEFIELALDTLTGDNYPTPDQVRYAMGKYKECPMCLALIVLAGHKLPELEEIHEKLKELATA